MKMIKYTLFGMLLVASSLLYAEGNVKSCKIDDMHMRKWQVLVEQVQLTQKEIDVVQPIFMEYEKSIWSLHKQNHDFFKSAFKDARNVKPNFAELNDKYVDFEFKEAQLFKNYHMKLRKVLQPETLFKYYKAERDFKRKLLRDIQDRRSPEKPKP